MKLSKIYSTLQCHLEQEDEGEILNYRVFTEDIELRFPLLANLRICLPPNPTNRVRAWGKIKEKKGAKMFGSNPEL